MLIRYSLADPRKHDFTNQPYFVEVIEELTDYEAESFSAEEDKIQAHIRNLQKRLDNIRPGDDFTWKTVNDALDKCYQQLESLAKDYPED
jgi:uncharacterized protein with HEPN domain